jgi:enoyl-CoA hydratase/carnithine racemase
LVADFLKAADSGLDPRALKFLNALARSQKPLVAAVGGVAIGIGTTMLFHFDHVVAGAGVVFSTPFLKLALIPEAASSLLAPTRMGYARAFSMLVMGRPLSAKVDDVALKAALEIAALPAGVVALARQLMRGHLDDVVERINTEATHFKELLKSDEARAAFEALLSRRK